MSYRRQLVRLLSSRLQGPGEGAEIGVLRGGTSEVLLQTFPKLLLWLVDPWTSPGVGTGYRESGDSAARLSQSEQQENLAAALARTEFAADRRRICPMTSQEAAARVPDRSLDFVFVDGDHTFDAVRCDLEAWYPKLRPGGLLCGHDYGHRRDRQGHWGVQRAVDEFARRLGLTVQVGRGTVWWIDLAESASPSTSQVQGVNGWPTTPAAQDDTLRVVGIIPARLESTRLPRKLVLRETGKPLIQHTWEMVRRSTALTDLVVATDSAEIAEVVQAFGGRCERTGPHPSGTDRTAEVVSRCFPDADIIVNVQGDEPELDAEHIDCVVKCLRERPATQIATLGAPIRAIDELLNPSCVKAVIAADRRALYFSREPVPYVRGRTREDVLRSEAPWIRHIGLYAYRRKALLELAALPVSPLERLECLEQLRALEAGYQIAVELVDHAPIGVDTEDDYRQFVARMASGAPTVPA